MLALGTFTRTCLFAHADRSENMMRANKAVLKQDLSPCPPVPLSPCLMLRNEISG
jgi:hypothetical protein